MNFFSDLRQAIIDLYSFTPSEQVDIGSIDVKTKKPRPKPRRKKAKFTITTKFGLATLLIYVLTGVLVLDLVTILVFSIVNPLIPVPVVYTTVATLIVAYLGGAITGIFKRQ